MNLFVNTRNGRGLHGTLKGQTFVREVDGRHIRWSDKAFAINSKIVKRLGSDKFSFIKFVQFRWRKATKIEVYSLSLRDFLKFSREIANEYGEKNYRLEISMFKLIKTYDLDPVPTFREQKSLEKREEKKETQATLF